MALRSSPKENGPSLIHGGIVVDPGSDNLPSSHVLFGLSLSTCQRSTQQQRTGLSVLLPSASLPLFIVTVQVVCSAGQAPLVAFAIYESMLIKCPKIFLRLCLVLGFQHVCYV